MAPEEVQTDGARCYSGDLGDLLSSPSPAGTHPVAAVLVTSSNAVAYMPSNEDCVLSSEDEDDNVSSGLQMPVNKVRHRAVAAVLPSLHTLDGGKLKAPLHLEHLFWCCTISGGVSGSEMIPLFDTLIDHGAHAVLNRESLVDELKLKRKKLPQPEEVEMAMPGKCELAQTTTLTEYVKIKLYCPISGWAA